VVALCLQALAVSGIEAHDGESGFTQAVSDHPDLIISDVKTE